MEHLQWSGKTNGGSRISLKKIAILANSCFPQFHFRRNREMAEFLALSAMPEQSHLSDTRMGKHLG
jgi:hypothetical protein